ncbi:MAG: CoA transferase [Dehalococcoidia bacterium]|nr:CoA transferase [Dehalococcoidia bacterium]
MPRLPLEGLRVVDFCVAWAGPYATMLLGDLGAEVIKVENPHVWPPVMRGGRARPTRESLAGMGGMYGGYPNDEPGPRPWNYSPTFVQPYRNKRSFTADLRTPEGLEILRRVVARSDVFVENNAADTTEKLGIDYEWLRSARPDIVMVRIPAFGLSGPYAHARALGVHLEAVMGHPLLRGYRDMDPSSNSIIFAGDYFGGLQAALAIMMAAWHRKKTGRGQLVEVSQAEAASAMFAQAYMEHALNGVSHQQLGNRSIYNAAPCGVYPCKSPGPASSGDDRWIAITVTCDSEWEALRAVMGRPAWAEDPALGTCAGRAERQDALDEGLATWTSREDDYDLFHRLQAAGVPAAPVLEASRALADQHFEQRGVFASRALFDVAGKFRFLAPFYRMPETPATHRQSPVAMGEHNEYVYRELLGVGEEEYRRLVAEGHISMDFDESIP